MGDIRTSANASFRDYATDGVPASGAQEPVKSEIRATFGVVEDTTDALDVRTTALEDSAGVGVKWNANTIRVRATGNVVIASALENGDTLNGVTLATGNHVFLGSQTAPAENGIYTVVASGAASRASFANSAAELERIGFLITEGTVGAGERWTLPLDAADITVGTTALTFAQIGIEVDTATQVAGLLTDVASLETEPGRLKPFADGVTLSDNLRNRVRELYVFDAYHTDYSLETFIIEVNGLKKRLRVVVRDNVAGVTACSESWSSADGATVADFVATLPEWLVLTDFLVSPSANKRRCLAHLRLDLSGITDVFSNLGSSSVLIHPDNIFTKDRQGNYLRDDTADVVITVGASGQDYTTYDDAYAALTSGNFGTTNINGQPVSNEASYKRRVRIFLTDAATYTHTKPVTPNFVEIDGVPGAELYCASPSTAGGLEMHGTGKIRNIRVRVGSTSKYALHMDDVNRCVTANGQFTFQRKLLEGVTLVNPAGSTVQVLGGGISSGEQWILRGVNAINLNAAATAAAIGVHNMGVVTSVPGSIASPYSASVIVEGGSSPNLLGLDFYSVAGGPTNNLILGNANFPMIRNGCNIADVDAPDLARSRYVWNIVGLYDGPVFFEDGNGQPVLATTAGQTPSGTAAALIFGTVDELGRGDLWIKNGTTKSLGARLGDCSSVSKALTIGAQTHTFTTNLTAASNTDIISAINGSITTHPVSEVDIKTEYVAPCQPQARMTNSTGATIPKGRFVKRTGASTVALAGPGDTIFGWTYREILNGSTGIVVTSRKVHETQIEGASSSTGAWGLAANGLLDYGAATAVGSTMGSVVEY